MHPAIATNPIKKLGFKHKFCLFHTFKNFNKIIKNYIKQNKLSKEEIKKIQEEKLELFSLFETESLKNIQRTSNKIENCFQKTFPKSVKKLMKIKNGVMSLINIRKEIQNQKKVFDNQPPSF